jgi:hypothetical protein
MYIGSNKSISGSYVSIYPVSYEYPIFDEDSYQTESDITEVSKYQTLPVKINMQKNSAYETYKPTA